MPISRGTGSSPPILTTTQQDVLRLARERGIHADVLGRRLVQLGEGMCRRLLTWHMTDVTSWLAVRNANDKVIAARILREAGLPSPRQIVVRSAEQALRAARALEGPVVVKPVTTNHGIAITLDPRGEEELTAAFAAARRHGARVLVQRFVPGDSTRFTFVGDRLVGVERLVAAAVTADGRQSIEALVAEANRDPRRSVTHEAPMKNLQLDEEALRLLRRDGWSTDSVPPAGTWIRLRGSSNISQGGTSECVLARVHPDNVQLARDAARVLGVDIAGVDVVLPDVARSWHETGAGILEVNVCPGLDWNSTLDPAANAKPDVAGAILELLFPQGTEHRIPLAVFPCPAPGHAASRLLEQRLQDLERPVGWAGHGGVRLASRTVRAGPAAGPRTARLLLRDVRLGALVLEMDPRRAAARGPGFTRCHALVLPPAAPTSKAARRGLDRLVAAADVVIARRRAGGWPGILRSLDPGRVILITDRQDDETVRTHHRRGGRVVLHRAGVARWVQRGRVLRQELHDGPFEDPELEARVTYWVLRAALRRTGPSPRSRDPAPGPDRAGHGGSGRAPPWRRRSGGTSPPSGPSGRA